MEAITLREFEIRQPYFPEKSSTSDFYLDIANKLLDEANKTEFGKSLPAGITRHLALTLTGYYQDIISDMGLWRSFINANRLLHGYTVPFHNINDDYVDYELNLEDVRFIAWYDIAMMDLERRDLYPLDKRLMEMADTLYKILDDNYNEAPVPDKYNIVQGLDLNDPDDKLNIYHLGHWLFNSSWLLTPAFALTLSTIINAPEIQADPDGPVLSTRLEEAILELPTGPLALFVNEWVYLLITGKMMRIPSPEESAAEHPYYEKFTKATGGREIAFFPDYESLNNFLISAMGWNAGEEHLPQMKKEKDFVLLVNKHKGMLLAKNIARCLKSPENPLYNKEYAETHAFELLTVRGLCPADLLTYIYANNMLPDAAFPGTHDKTIVQLHHDFIERCYLQQYYRGD